MASSLVGGGDDGSSKVSRRPLSQNDHVKQLLAVKEVKDSLLVTNKAIPSGTDKIK
jgi:hypothetical protein